LTRSPISRQPTRMDRRFQSIGLAKHRTPSAGRPRNGVVIDVRKRRCTARANHSRLARPAPDRTSPPRAQARLLYLAGVRMFRIGRLAQRPSTPGKMRLTEVVSRGGSAKSVVDYDRVANRATPPSARECLGTARLCFMRAWRASGLHDLGLRTA